VHWNDIEVHFRGEVLTSTGHGFSGMSRHALLRSLQTQACDAGVQVQYEREVSTLDAFADADLVVGSDGVNSTVRRLLEPRIETQIDVRQNRFVWLGTTKPFPAFTFYFRETVHGLWRVHAYQYEPGHSTFIVECGEATWRAAGMETASEQETATFLEQVFAAELAGHRLITNRSLWRQFSTIQAQPWSAGNVVLIGDAAHTAHFSVGSGTRMAMEDAAALRDALSGGDVAAGLAAYEQARRPQVESLQRAASASLQWFEETERYMRLDPVQFTVSLMTRSLLAAPDARGSARARSGLHVARRQHRCGHGRGAERRRRVPGLSATAADVHAVPAARSRAAEPCGRLADVPVPGRGRHDW
jgi:anthraniloyl-CoA monooxygenase